MESSMRTWLKRTLIGLFGASVIFGGIAACSHRHHHHGWSAIGEEDAAKMKARLVEKVGDRLDLDAAQRAKLGVIADRVREQRNAFVAGGHPRDELRALVAGATFDRAKAQSLLQSKTESITTQSPELIAAIADFYDSLRPEQQSKVREYMARRGRG
jgi:Spy/CpxP family protein refolding chaperone